MAPGPLNVRYEADMTLDVFRARFRVLNIVDDVTWECFAAIPDTSISGRRVEVNDRVGRPPRQVDGGPLTLQ